MHQQTTYPVVLNSLCIWQPELSIMSSAASFVAAIQIMMTFLLLRRHVPEIMWKLNGAMKNNVQSVGRDT